MAQITTEQVKALRDETGISVMQCKKALEEAGGDIEKARIILQKQSKASASKKGDRSLGAGIVESYVHAGGTVGSLVELLCETDFVAKNEAFKALAHEIAMHVAATNPEYKTVAEISPEARKKAEEVFADEVKGKPENLREKILTGKLDAYFKDKILLEQSYIKNPDKTIKNLVEEAVHKFGERIEIGRFSRFSVQ